MSDEVKLEPCPNPECKGVAKKYGWPAKYKGRTTIECPECYCHVAMPSCAEAIAAWNRRAVPVQDAKVAALVEACNAAAIVLETAIAPDDAFMQKNAPMSATIFREAAAKLRKALAVPVQDEKTDTEIMAFILALCEGSEELSWYEHWLKHVPEMAKLTEHDCEKGGHCCPKCLIEETISRIPECRKLLAKFSPAPAAKVVALVEAAKAWDAVEGEMIQRGLFAHFPDAIHKQYLEAQQMRADALAALGRE